MPTAGLRLVDSRIIGATVFSDAAHVTRRATLRLERGAERVAIKNLPRELDPGSVRVSTSRGLVRALERDTISEGPDATSDSAVLERAIQVLEAKSWRLIGERDALVAELALIDRVVPAGHFDGSSPAPLRPESFLAGLDALITRRKSALKTLRKVEVESQTTIEELHETRARLTATGTTAGAGHKRSTLIIHLDIDDPGESSVDIVYEAAWATWRPHYHIRLDPKDRTIECGRFADVWQETGEDWSEIRMRLSTAEPETGLVLPNVLPWTLGSAKSYEDKLGDLYKRRKSDKKERARAPRKPASVSAPPAPLARGGPPPPGNNFQGYAEQFEEEGAFAETTASGMDMLRNSVAPGGAPQATTPAQDGGGARIITVITEAPPPPPPPTTARRAEPPPDISERDELLRSPAPRDLAGGIDHEMEVEVATTCPSGKERRRIGLGSVSYPARIEYLLRPAVRDHAFGRVTVINNENAPLIAGPASIFVGEAFFGETRIRTTPAGGKLVLELGAETAIKSARRSKTTVRTEGILTKEDVHVVEVTTEIENHLDQSIDVEIQDQVPVSQDPRVKVRLMRTIPKDAQLDELTGILTFKVRLTPGTKVEIGLVYEIEAPKDYEFQQTLRE
jgi:hypothetical protein